MTITNRMIRAARLDSSLYEEVEADQTLTGQAMGVVVLSAVAAGIGALSWGVFGLVWIALVSLIVWYLWAYLTFFMGTRLLPEPQTHTDLGQMLRTIGFASSPGIIRVLGVIPGLGQLIFLAASVWMLIATVVAVRQALDYTSTARAVGVVAVGWVVQMIALFLVMAAVRPAL